MGLLVCNQRSRPQIALLHSTHFLVATLEAPLCRVGSRSTHSLLDLFLLPPPTQALVDVQDRSVVSGCLSQICVGQGVLRGRPSFLAKFPCRDRHALQVSWCLCMPLATSGDTCLACSRFQILLDARIAPLRIHYKISCDVNLFYCCC